MTEYPKPRIPAQPVLSLASLISDKGSAGNNVLDAGDVRFVTSGRMAIALALQQMNIGRDDKVLVPAYHCSSMINPVVWVGATPSFYRIHHDTSVDLEDIRNKIDANTKLLLVANYFGFPQDLPAIRAFCDHYGLLLLEDCAHAFFGQSGGRPLGSFGDYAIASCTKFFPVFDGGCLISSRHRLAGIDLRGAGLGFEIKSAVNTLERGFTYKRMEPLRILLASSMRLKDRIWQRVKKRTATGHISLAPGSSEGGFEFEPEWIRKRSSLMSSFIVKYASRKRIASKRRANYTTLLRVFKRLPGCQPLFPALPDDVVPYVLPIIVDKPEWIFPALKRAGVPVIRFAEFLWPGVDAQTCAVSADLSRRVMQFPCHQELAPSEFEWLIETVNNVFLSSGHIENGLEAISN